MTDEVMTSDERLQAYRASLDRAGGILQPTSEQWDQLRAPFEPGDVGKLPKGPSGGSRDDPRCDICGSKHATQGFFHVDYVGHAHVTERLNQVDPSWRMRRSPIQFDDRSMAFMEVELTVLGVTHEEVGCADTNLAEWPKLLYSDALTRAAMRFGVALDLWKKVKGGGEYRTQGGPRSSGGGSSGARSGSGRSGAASTTSPGVEVLLEALKGSVAAIATDGGRAEWIDWKDEKGWDQLWKDGKLEGRRELVEEAGRWVRDILNAEATARGDEPWDPLQGTGPVAGPGDGQSGVDGADADQAHVDPEDQRSPGSAGIDGDTGGGSEADEAGRSGFETDDDGYSGGYG